MGLYSRRNLLGGTKTYELVFRGSNIDQRGFGQSDNPATVELSADFDFVADASSAVTYLGSVPGVDGDRVYVVGHSFGGDVAIAASIAEPRIVKIVAIGPSRRVHERYESEQAYFERRLRRYMRLPQNVWSGVITHMQTSLPLENHLDYFAQPEHKPILLIDGAAENEADRRYPFSWVTEKLSIPQNGDRQTSKKAAL
jgi:pimeloyl-ACP methyl ester carboxylesterase